MPLPALRLVATGVSDSDAVAFKDGIVAKLATLTLAPTIGDGVPYTDTVTVGVMARFSSASDQEEFAIYISGYAESAPNNISSATAWVHNCSHAEPTPFPCKEGIRYVK